MLEFHRSAAISITVVLLIGCTEIENPRTLTPGEPGVGETRSSELQRAQFDDLPIPPGFTYVTRGNRSFSFIRGGVRVCRLVYWGRMGVAEASTFFRRNMGLRAYGWVLSSEDAGRIEATMKFRKDALSCDVTITKNPGGGTYVRIDVTGPA